VDVGVLLPFWLWRTRGCSAFRVGNFCRDPSLEVVMFRMLIVKCFHNPLFAINDSMMWMMEDVISFSWVGVFQKLSSELSDYRLDL
jgi:hypothetical protein